MTTREPLPRPTGNSAPVPGKVITGRRPPAIRGRYRTLCWLEDQFFARPEPSNDFGYLIGPACQLLEVELETLLTTPARAVGQQLVAALAAEPKNRKQADVLAAWAAERVPATIGTASLILLALRRGVEQRNPELLAYLEAAYFPEFTALLCSKHLQICLDRIREQFRNPVAHGRGVFDLAGYEHFVNLLVGHRRFSLWVVDGATQLDPPGQTAFLHQLLRTTRAAVTPTTGGASATDAFDAVERLLGLATSRAQPWAVDVKPYATGSSREVADHASSPPREPRPLRLGDRLAFALQVGQPAYVALIDVGATCACAVLLPNRWRLEVFLKPGRVHFLPRALGPEFTLTVTGEPGLERILALATLTPLPEWLVPGPDQAFKPLVTADLDRLEEAIRALDPVTWSAAVCEFTVIPRERR